MVDNLKHDDQRDRAERLLASATEAREAACSTADADLLLLSSSAIHRAHEILERITVITRTS
jgi:hypothetical protein